MSRSCRYVRGEACVALGFSMHDADGSGHLNAVLGCAINQDGRSSSLTAPNGPSQQQVRLCAPFAAEILKMSYVLHPVNYSTTVLCAAVLELPTLRHIRVVCRL